MSSVPELAAPKGAQHCSSFSAVACDSAAYAKPLVSAGEVPSTRQKVLCGTSQVLMVQLRHQALVVA